MEDAGKSAVIGTLLIVDNFVEADDLQDAFERRHLGPVVHMRSVETARAMLEETASRPRIIVIGATAAAVLTDALIEEQRARGARVLVLKDAPPEGLPPGITHLSRPYAETDLSRAIDQLMAQTRSCGAGL